MSRHKHITYKNTFYDTLDELIELFGISEKRYRLAIKKGYSIEGAIDVARYYSGRIIPHSKVLSIQEEIGHRGSLREEVRAIVDRYPKFSTSEITQVSQITHLEPRVGRVLDALRDDGLIK